MKFIFGLKVESIEHVLLQYPKAVQEAKQIAEELDIVHQGVERHENEIALEQNQTSNKKQGKKGILGNVLVKGVSSISIKIQESGRGADRRGRDVHRSIVLSVAV